MKTLELTFHSDPGHGWLEVPKRLLSDLAIQTKITPWSYMDDDNAYLEEDLDYSVFVEAAKAQGYELTISETYQDNTPIRHMQSYSAC